MSSRQFWAFFTEETDRSMNNSTPESPYGQAPQPPGRPPHSPDNSGSSFPSMHQGPVGSDDNKAGRIGLIAGLVGLLVWILGPVAAVFGFVGFRAVKKGKADNKIPSLVGLVLGLIETLALIIVTIVLVVTLTAGGSAIKGGSKGASPADGTIDSKIDDAKMIAEIDGVEIRAVITTATLRSDYFDPELRSKEIPVVKHFVTNNSDSITSPRLQHSCSVHDGLRCGDVPDGTEIDDDVADQLGSVGGEMRPGETHIRVIGLGFAESRIDTAEVTLHVKLGYSGDEQTYDIITPKK